LSGKCVSIDHIVSAQPGLIPQLSGQLTLMRIWAAQVHVDHFSDHTYVHLMRYLTIDETLVAKEAYERYINQNEHTVDGYIGDNVRFPDK
jgi:hypothetical protein